MGGSRLGGGLGAVALEDAGHGGSGNLVTEGGQCTMARSFLVAARDIKFPMNAGHNQRCFTQDPA